MHATVAGAPVSFGVFELTPEGAEVLGPDEMLDILTGTGYAGVDLGPEGFFGTGRELQDRLRRHSLELAGGWVQLPFSDDEAFAAALPGLDRALALFSDAAATGPSRLPKPTLADDGSVARTANPGRGAEVDSLDPQAWGRLVKNVTAAADRVRAAGLEPTFHHHAGTYVESPAEIDRFLAEVEIGLTLDTGHLLIGGGDPLDVLRRWGSRVNHLHLKDVDTTLLNSVVAAGGGMPEVWSSGAFTAFGRGDIDLAPILDAAEEIGYDGWIVVEQDVLNKPGISLAEFRTERSADQRVNREALRAWA